MIHFEIPGTNPEQNVAFFQAAFGRRLHKMAVSQYPIWGPGSIACFSDPGGNMMVFGKSRMIKHVFQMATTSQPEISVLV